MPMTPAEVVAEMQSDSLLNKVRQALSNHHGKMEQFDKDIIKLRNMEFDAARELIKLVREHTEDDKPLHCPGCDGDHL